MTKTAPEILHEAARLVERGWHQGEYYNEGCFCADGAMQVVAGVAVIDEQDQFNPHPDYRETDSRAYVRAYNAACAAAQETDYGQHNIIGFNDDGAKSATDVVKVLLRAAEIAGS